MKTVVTAEVMTGSGYIWSSPAGDPRTLSQYRSSVPKPAEAVPDAPVAGNCADSIRTG